MAKCKRKRGHFSRRIDVDISGTNIEIYKNIHSILLEESQKNKLNNDIQTSKITVPLKDEESFGSLKKYDSIEIGYSNMQEIIDKYFETYVNDYDEINSLNIYRYYKSRHKLFFNEIVLKLKNDTEESELSSGMLLKIKNFNDGLLIEHYSYLTGTPVSFILTYIINSDFQVTLINKKTLDDFSKEINKNFFINNKDDGLKKRQRELLDNSEGLLFQIILFLCYISNKLENTNTNLVAKISNNKVTNKVSKDSSKSTKSSNKHVYYLDDLINITIYKSNGNKALTKKRWKNREHSVRGFPRHYKSGKVVWIEPHIRGSSKNGEKIAKKIVL